MEPLFSITLKTSPENINIHFEGTSHTVKVNTLYSKTTIKSAHAATSIKQSPVLKGHLFLSCHKKINMN